MIRSKTKASARKRVSRFIRRALLASFFLCEIVAARTNYKKWLAEEVVWIISHKERQSFQNQKSDPEREKFIQRFWQRRDPTPSTPRNEFKEEHYRRYGHALKTFQEGTPGWKTDRGRIYIIHGPPDKEDYYTSESRMRVKTDSNDSRPNPANDRSRTPNTIIWSYRQNPNGKYYRGELKLVFQPSVGLSRESFVLGESKTAQDKADQLSRQFGPAADQTWLEGDVRYRLIVAGPPALVNARGLEIPSAGLGESAQYLEDLLRSPGEILEEALLKTEEREKAKQQIREAVTTRLSFGSLPLELASRSYVQKDGNYRIHLQVDVPRSELASLLRKDKPQDGSRLDLYCALVNSQGQIADEFIDSLDIQHSILASHPSGNLHYLNSFAAAPGNYTLKAAIRSEVERLGYREIPIQLTRDQPTIRLSDVLVTNQVEAVNSQEASTGAGNSVHLGDARFLPNPAREFARSDSLLVYFQIFLPKDSVVQNHDLSVAMNFISGDRIARRLEPRRISESNSEIPGVINFATTLPLESFAPGDYVLQVQAIDHVSKKFSIQRATFHVAIPQ